MQNKIPKIIAFIGILNFLAFVIVAVVMGGDALNGKASNGHYFLGSHGRLTEVSREVYVYSVCHACSAVAGLIVTFVLAAWMWKLGSDR
jgi:hypothetical protein